MLVLWEVEDLEGWLFGMWWVFWHETSDKFGVPQRNTAVGMTARQHAGKGCGAHPHIQSRLLSFLEGALGKIWTQRNETDIQGPFVG